VEGGTADAARRSLVGASGSLGEDGGVLHRHPFLSLLTLVYLGFVGLVTLAPASRQPDYSALAERVLARLERYPELAPITERLSVDRVEFLANIGLFVPVGVFVLLLFGSGLWWLAVAGSVALTSVIETAQQSIPGRVSDPRDVVANSIGAVIGVVLALVLTLPGTLRRRQRRRARSM
jgi:glycopeptide antibiotics resistance protein